MRQPSLQTTIIDFREPSGRFPVPSLSGGLLGRAEFAADLLVGLLTQADDLPQVLEVEGLRVPPRSGHVLVRTRETHAVIVATLPKDRTVNGTSTSSGRRAE